MNIVFYDVETSGTNPQEHEIIQIAALAIETRGSVWTPVGQIERKMFFDHSKADPQALEINHYDPVAWETEAVSQEQGLNNFDAWIRTYRDVKRVGKASGKEFYNVRTGGHNVLKFDDGVVREWYKRHDKFCPFDYSEIYDTLQAAKWVSFWNEIQTEDHKLETLCKAYGIELTGAHDALADVQATARLAWSLRYKKITAKEQ